MNAIKQAMHLIIGHDTERLFKGEMEMNKTYPMPRWEKIKTMPSDEFVLLGVWVNHLNIKDPKPEFYIACHDSVENALFDLSWEQSLPWEKDDFDFWMNIPSMPKVYSNAK